MFVYTPQAVRCWPFEHRTPYSLHILSPVLHKNVGNGRKELNEEELFDMKSKKRFSPSNNNTYSG